MPLVNRFHTIDHGAITFTGNTLGLSPVQPEPNIDTLGIFTSVNTSLQVSGYPQGTTQDWQQNSSSAILSIPPESEILYAELLWGGTCKTDLQDSSAYVNDPITLITPSGQTLSIIQDPDTAETYIGGTQGSYLRSAIITEIINTEQSGSYTVTSVPGVYMARNQIDRTLGWTLQVVYKNSSLPLQSLATYVGFVNISSQGRGTDVTITGFKTPPTGPVSGRVLVTALEGDSCIEGDQLRIGGTASSTIPLSGPQNPVNNFFGSQICNDQGELDSSGTFGTLNQPLGGNCQPIRRQGWDITNIDASSGLTNNQSSAVLRFTTAGDGYSVLGFAIEFISLGLDLTVNKHVDAETACPGNILTYTVQIQNQNESPATNIIFRDTIPNGTVFIPNSIKINGTPISGSPTDGILIGDICPDQVSIVTFQVQIEDTTSSIISNTATVKGDNIDEISSNNVTTYITNAHLTLEKEADVGAIKCGDTITYTLSITNDGPDDIKELNILDTIDPKTTFISGSLTIDGIAQSNVDLNTGILIKDIAIETTTIIQFKVVVNPNTSGWIFNRAEAMFCGANIVTSNQTRVKICKC
ncbi:hypothetical protein [Bacillus paranthracis]|uniref:hypothetical protein n=1 Tax=Bacillus paranthracis TaxID=2026186 RepID=UPI003D64A6FE